MVWDLHAEDAGKTSAKHFNLAQPGTSFRVAWPRGVDHTATTTTYYAVSSPDTVFFSVHNPCFLPGCEESRYSGDGLAFGGVTPLEVIFIPLSVKYDSRLGGPFPL